MPETAGLLAALVTPMQPDGRLNTDVVADLVEMELAQGIDGFYVGGSTGEAFLLSSEERAEVLRAVAAACAGRCTLVAHVGTIATADMVALAEAAADAGYHAVSSIPPFYYKFSAAEVAAHYRALTEATALPAICYNFPQQSGVTMTTADLIAVLSAPGFSGLKHTSNDFYQLERVRKALPEIAIYNGYDEQFLAGLAMGADGGIGSTYNYMGHLFVGMRRHFRAGELEAAKRLQRAANDLIDAIVAVGVMQATKALLAIQGIDCGPCRAPFAPLSTADIRKLERALQALPA